jgi:hypothetical protein
VVGLVEAQDWSKIPATVAIFVESAVRTWAGLDDGAYGKGASAAALANANALRLGSATGLRLPGFAPRAFLVRQLSQLQRLLNFRTYDPRRRGGGAV